MEKPDGWYIVGKPFIARGKRLEAKAPVYAGDFRNTESLLKVRYLREPKSDEEIEEIVEAEAKRAKKKTETA